MGMGSGRRRELGGFGEKLLRVVGGGSAGATGRGRRFLGRESGEGVGAGGGLAEGEEVGGGLAGLEADAVDGVEWPPAPTGEEERAPTAAVDESPLDDADDAAAEDEDDEEGESGEGEDLHGVGVEAEQIPPLCQAPEGECGHEERGEVPGESEVAEGRAMGDGEAGERGLLVWESGSGDVAPVAKETTAASVEPDDG